jgi:hypothetical protein
MIDDRMVLAACRRALGVAALLGSTAAMAAAQPSVTQAGKGRTALVGMIRDSSGRAISGVEIWLRGSDLYTITNDAGGFRIPNTPIGPVKVTVRRLGYEQATVDLTLREGQTDSLVVALTTVAANLPGVEVVDEAETRSKRLLAGFWERRSRGFGHYYTREDIAKRNPHDFVDIVRMTPSLSIVMNNGRKLIRFSRGSGRADCPPQYFVDGMRLENATPDEFPPGDIEAIELYSGAATIPAQFAPKFQTVRQQTCGVIVIWTRLPGT